MQAPQAFRATRPVEFDAEKGTPRYGGRQLLLAALTMIGLAIAAPAWGQQLAITPSLLDAPGGMAETGADFRYRISYSCSIASPPPSDCDGVTVEVDLPPEVVFVSSFFPPGDVASGVHDSSPMGGTVTFTFNPNVPAGNTGDLDITVRFPNGSTPDGTMTTVTPGEVRSMGTMLISQSTELPQVTASASPMVDLDVSLVDGFLDSCQAPGPPGAFPSTYEVTIGPSTADGSLDFVDVAEVVLTLPTGVDTVVPMGGGVFDMAMNTVTWSSLGPISVGSTVTVSVGLNFPQPTFGGGQTVTATADARVDVLDAPPDPTLVAFGPIDFMDALSAFAETASSAVSKAFADGRPASLPPAEGQAFAYDVRIRNTGNLPLDTLSVIDDGDGAGAAIDAGIDVRMVSTGAYSPAPTSITINVTGDMGSTPSITSLDGTTDTMLDLTLGGMLMAGERADRIEWVFNGGAPAGMAPTTSARIDAVANVGFAAGTTVDNHLTSTWTASPTMPSPCGAPVPPAAGSNSGSRSYDVNDPYVYLRPAKNETSTGPYLPMDTVSFSFDVTNDVLANDPASGVVVTDLLPEFLAFQTGTNAEDFTLAPGVSLSTFEEIDNYGGSGRTLLRWTLMGDLDPGETVIITFDTTVVLGVLFGNLTNEMGITIPAGPTEQECAVGSQSGSIDDRDLDGDGDDTDSLCLASEGVQIAAVAQLRSEKLVRGQCDGAFLGAAMSPGTSLPGGAVDWRIEVQNIQTVPIENFVLIDIFPFVGDTGVVDTNPRSSLFDPLLIAPITPPAGGAVFYSTSGNPCRGEVGGPAGGCDAGTFSSVPPTPITATRSIRIDFGDRVLNPLDLLTFEWTMALPADAPTDGSEAFNSFAFGSNRQDDGGFLSSEPLKVGIDAACAPSAPDDAMLGDFVWLDSNGDGDQDGGELGVNDVPVQLFDPGPDGLPRTGDDVLVLSTITADDDMGNPGWYKFSALSPGDYYVAFTPPPNFEVTVQDAGGDEALDSDADPQSACTDVVTLGPSENNPDVDLGLLAPTTASLGNYVWFDRDGDGIQDEALTDGLNGVAVKLFTDDGDGNPEPGGDDGTPLQVTVTDDDGFGNPGFYRFDGLAPGTPYFVQVMLPPTATGFTSLDAGGDDAVDSDTRSSDGTTQVVTLTPGEHDPTLDSGLVRPTGTLSLGNVVWMDDGDDVFDALSADMPTNGVRVNLYLDDSGDGLPQASEYLGSTVTSTLAGKDGRYRFDDLAPGDYIVEIPASNFGPGASLEGKISVPFSTVDPNDDVDHDDSGDHLATTVVSQPVALSVDGEPTPDADDDLEDDNDVHFALDFGFVIGTVVDHDFGDHPDAGAGTAQGNYRTTVFDDGAFHELTGPMGPYLGDCVDSDTGTQQSVGADADDLGGALTITHGACATAGDDEDGVGFSATLLAIGGSVDVTVSSSSAIPCLVSGWVDWNRDGAFDDFAPEKILTDVASGFFAGIAVPPTAVPGVTYSRFRCSSAGGDAPTGGSADGEVEDYLLRVMGADWGDAPDVPYGTLMASGGPMHDTDPDVELYLGACVDTEPDGQPSFGADADDTMLGDSRIGDCIDDEDGVTFDTMLVRGQMATLTVTASMPGRLDAWIDFDRDAANGFTGPDDQILTDEPLVAGPNVFMFAVPPLADVGLTHSRFRFSSAGGLGPGGMAADGEVEDHTVLIKGFDFGDLPEPIYPTLLASGGAQHVVDPASSVFLGPPVVGCADVEDDGAPSGFADGDDVTPTLDTGADAGICDDPDDEDGVTIPGAMVIACQTAAITVEARGAGRLDAWIDFDRFTSPGLGPSDQIATNMAIGAGPTVLNIPVPCTADVNAASYARFRLSTAGGLAVGGLAMDGEVEDYEVFVKGSDFGDAPDSYGTSVGSGSAALHGVDVRPGNEFVLGACADTEVDGPAAGTAVEDDGAAGTSTAGTCAVAGDDEDGVAFAGGMAMASVCTTGNALDVTLLNSAGVATPLLDAWIDFDGNGAFDHPAEHLFGGTSTALAGGLNNLSYDVPCTALPQATSYARFRLSSGGGLLPGGPSMDGEVEDYAFQVKGVDFGDAPDSYSTVFSSNGPWHTVDPSLDLFLGSCVDTETDGQVVSGDATDDDTSGGSTVDGVCVAGDDEDGVTFDTPITACKSATITVTAGSAGLLDAWIDFDIDGDFTIGSDQIFVSEPLAAGPNVLNFPVPCTAAEGDTFARFRLSSAGGLSFDGPAVDGEVEDYQIGSSEADYGDAPDTYATTFVAGGPLHGLDNAADLYLGACVDSEADGQPSAGADGDDLGAGLSDLGGCAGPDDEDGVSFDTMIIACQTAQLTVTASTAGLLDAWIDLDGDGTFAGPDDQIFASQALVAGANVLPVPVPCGVQPGDTYARFRVSSVGGLGFGGTTSDGEVEDYQVTVKGADLGDAPDSYQTTFGVGGPSHGVDPAAPLLLGACVDTDADGQSSVGADGDDLGVGISTVGACAVANDDEDGVVFDTEVNVCLTADITVTASAAGVLDAWLDLDGSGDFTGPDDQIFTGQALLAGPNILSFPVPCDATPGDSYARFRFSSGGASGPAGPSMDGEVEDYAVLVQGFDFGDAPDPTYPTLLASDGARHIVLTTGNPTLGDLADIETEGLQSPDHLGDDLDGTDDEDGVVFLESVLIPGTDTTIELTAGAVGGSLSAWLDWNRDGDWNDAGEQIATDLAIAAGTTESLVVPVPVPAVAGDTCVRFRFSSETGLAPTGQAADGEVEDYRIEIGVEEPQIGLGKSLISAERRGTNEWELLFEMNVDNTGNVPLSMVQVVADLATVFAEADGYVVESLDSADLTVNPAFDGDGDPNLLTGGDTLAVGGSGSLLLQVLLMPGFELGPYECTSIAIGESPGDDTVTDESQDGGDSDPDNDGDPTNNDDPTIFVIDIPPIDIPTLDHVGLVGLGLLLALLGVGILRRR